MKNKTQNIKFEKTIDTFTASLI